MKLATLIDGTRDGRLVVVSRDGQRCADASTVARSLQAALDDWESIEPRLRQLSAELESGALPSEPLAAARIAAPLPRAYEWIDGSAFVQHVELVRRARGVAPPASLRTDPLVYQGGSGVLLGPSDPLVLPDPAWGLDLEAEICVVLGDTPRGVRASEATRHVRLLLLANDATYRELVPHELAKGFGFFQSKPATAFSPFAVTPDELEPAWRDGRVHLRLRSMLNDELLGDPDAGEMHFSFFDLIEHIGRTRAFTAGTIVGSGTVSNTDPARGVSCLVERRMREVVADGATRTPYLGYGDRIRIEMYGADGVSVFGAITQEVVRP
jgi:fumarylacetoacetate (FAA) hydrolase